jgi:hypothetical protein
MRLGKQSLKALRLLADKPGVRRQGEQQGVERCLSPRPLSAPEPLSRAMVGLHALKLARTSTTNGPFAVMADRFARLHVVFTSSHFFLFSAPLNQFTEASERFLNGLAVSDLHVNHRHIL